MRVYCIIIIVLFCVFSFQVKANENLFSPDKTVLVQLVSSSDGLLLDITIDSLKYLAKVGIEINEKTYLFNEKYTVKSNLSEDKNLFTIQPMNTPLCLEIAMLNNAVAFRYQSSKIGEGAHVNTEKSAFCIKESCRVWYFERKNDWKLKSYAGTWENCKIEELPNVSDKNTIQGPPLLFEYPNGKIAVATEVNLQAYSGLRWDCSEPYWLTSNFTEGGIGFKLDENLCTPWRVVFVVKNLTELVNQQVISQLSPMPNKKLYDNTDYIKPGKSVWRWFSRGTGKNVAEEREFVDYAASLGFTYSVIDEGWADWDNCWQDLNELSHYAHERNVKLFIWNHSKNIRDPKNDYLQMRNWLDQVQQAGISGVKVDFMNSESKQFIDFDIRLLKECAKRRLLVNFHGCQKPSGEQYSYPNEITREGIRGLELNKLEEGPITSTHNALLPFTRLAIGHGDYTPLSFVNPGNTTFAHQLATLIAFDSPMQIIAEDPEVLLTHLSIMPALDFIKAVPTVWDETIVLPQTTLGKTSVVARRSGFDWYIYALNGTNQSFSFTIDIAQFEKDFSDKEMILFTDDTNALPVKIEMKNHRPSPLEQAPVIPFKKTVTAGEAKQNIVLAPNGGAVLWLRSI